MKRFEILKNLRKYTMTGLVALLFFGLFGCGRGSGVSREEVVRKYLEKHYRKEFTVETLLNRSSGPFSSDYYSGFAYETGKPFERFTVWVNKRNNKVIDSYWALQFRPQICNMIHDAACEVWPEVKTDVYLDVYGYNTAADYKEDELASFLENESVDISAYVFLPDSMISVEEYKRFDNKLNDKFSGFVKIFLKNSDIAGLNPDDYLGEEEDCSIMIGSEESVISYKLSNVK